MRVRRENGTGRRACSEIERCRVSRVAHAKVDLLPPAAQNCNIRNSINRRCRRPRCRSRRPSGT
jgi:hypothetical protein